jgi:hypothetical protein
MKDNVDRAYSNAAAVLAKGAVVPTARPPCIIGKLGRTWPNLKNGNWPIVVLYVAMVSDFVTGG